MQAPHFVLCTAQKRTPKANPQRPEAKHPCHLPSWLPHLYCKHPSLCIVSTCNHSSRCSLCSILSVGSLLPSGIRFAVRPPPPPPPGGTVGLLPEFYHLHPPSSRPCSLELTLPILPPLCSLIPPCFPLLPITLLRQPLTTHLCGMAEVPSGLSGMNSSNTPNSFLEAQWLSLGSQLLNSPTRAIAFAPGAHSRYQIPVFPFSSPRLKP